MPIGVTAEIYDGKDVSLRDYLMRVGRSMSLAIMPRDDDPHEPVRRREVSSYVQNRVAEARAKIEALANMTVEDAQIASEQSDAEQRAEAIQRAVQRNTELRKRYESMLAQVEAWEPDEKVAYIKEQAIRYLKESIDFDCSDDPTEFYPKPGLIKAQSEAAKELARAEQRLAEEIDRVKDYNEHIDAFLASLPSD